MRYFVTLRGQSIEVELTTSRDGRTLARLWNEGKVAGEHALDLRPVAGVAHVAVELDGRCHDVLFEEDARGLHLTLAGERHPLTIEDERERAAHLTAASAPKGPVSVKSEMPGIVRAVLVNPGDVVEPGQPLVILEAMKMENELRAQHAGRVREVQVAAGTAVERGALLLVLDPLDADRRGER